MPGRGSPAISNSASASTSSSVGRGRASPATVLSPTAASAAPSITSPSSLAVAGQRDERGITTTDLRNGGERKPPLRLKPFLPKLIDTRPLETKSEPGADKGKSGKELEVKTNFMSITKPLAPGDEFKKLYVVKSYFVEFQPMIMMRADKTRVLQNFFTQTLKMDPKKVCFQLQGNYMVVPATSVTDVSKDIKTDHVYDVDNVKLQFSLRRTSDAFSGDCLSVIDSVLTGMIRKGGYKYLNNIAINLKSNKPIQDVPEAYSVQGFVPTVCPIEAGLYMQVALQVKVLSKEPLSAMLKAKANRMKSAGEFHDWVEKQFYKRYVMAKHNDTFYQIDSFDWKADENMTVDLTTRVVSVRDYFKERYNIALESKEFIVMVKSVQIGNEPKRKAKKSPDGNDKGDKKPEVPAMPMPASLLILCSIHPDVRDDARRMRNVLAAGRKEPAEYYDSLGKFASMFFENADIKQEAEKRGFEFLSEDDLKPARARALGVQPLHNAGASALRYDEATADWVRNVRSSPITRQAQLPADRIRLLFLAGDRDMQLARDFANILAGAVKSMGIKFDAPEFVVVPRASQDVSGWSDMLIGSLGQNRSQLDQVVALLPDDSAERYKVVKQLTVLSQHAITSQCVKVNTIREPKKQMTVATKLGMQMCAKLGGAIWRTNFSDLGLSAPLFIGILVHKMPKSFDKFATIVGNIDKQVTSYTLEVVPTVSLKDAPRAIADIAKCVKSVIETYMEQNKTTPSHVIVHRLEDNEGFLEHHHMDEGPKMVDTIYAACEGRGPKPHVVYMLASKQTKTRFWQHNKQTKEHANCTPGTVLDTVVVSPLRHDFYLISSAPRQGISGPTYYNILINTGSVTMDVLQVATYRLTMLYYNWTGPVSIPATLQYALKAAKLIGDSLGHEGALVVANNKFGLRNQLFYL